ncbi:glycosyltransferase family 2 protein [Longitalea luteola]|uniref:glycosyltransferase family 2 protein n=1 Tax=Longitalea luteola TaxID=2812563 RepID=UPI001A96F260|nr:glycosyltransferase [Longitalea luteola]
MDLKPWPLVTVGTLSYNTGKYVVEALECVKRQQYPNIQHIIIDDCSSDNSAQLIEDWIKQNNYPCLFIKRPVNKGVHAGLMDIMAAATGKYLVMISDDLWTDDKLLKQVQAFEELDSSYAMVYGDTQMIDKDGNVLIPSMFKHYRGADFLPPSGNIFQEVVRDFYFFIQAATISLEHFKAINYTFDKEIISEDWDWQLALARRFNILGLNRIFSSYRFLATSVGRTNWTDEKMHKVWQSHGKMLLKHYNHSENSIKDKEIIFQRIWRVYNELCGMPRFTKKQKIRFLLHLIKVTRKLKLLIVLASIIIFSKESLARRITQLA